MTKHIWTVRFWCASADESKIHQWTVRTGYGIILLLRVCEWDLLFLNIFHHAVNALLCRDMGAMDQAIGCGVEVLTAVKQQQRNYECITTDNKRFNMLILTFLFHHCDYGSPNERGFGFRAKCAGASFTVLHASAFKGKKKPAGGELFVCLSVQALYNLWFILGVGSYMSTLTPGQMTRLQVII